MVSVGTMVVPHGVNVTLAVIQKRAKVSTFTPCGATILAHMWETMPCAVNAHRTWSHIVWPGSWLSRATAVLAGPCAQARTVTAVAS